MKAMILAAGLGTRLKPWTLEHPKALVPVGDVPMLERVIERLKEQGFDRFVINIHHFGEQILEFLASRDFGVEISVSDERGHLLDTGGGILHASPFLNEGDEPFLVHNVDILSNADLRGFMAQAQASGGDALLLVSDRDSSRKLRFSPAMELTGWHNLSTGEVRAKSGDGEGTEYAFSGIYALKPSAFEGLRSHGERFPVMDYFLGPRSRVFGHLAADLRLIDIGKPESLSRACNLLSTF